MIGLRRVCSGFRTATGVGCAVLAMVAVGCAKSDKSVASASASASAPTVPALGARLSQVASACKVFPEKAVVARCRGDEKRLLLKYYDDDAEARLRDLDGLVKTALAAVSGESAVSALVLQQSFLGKMRAEDASALASPAAALRQKLPKLPRGYQRRLIGLTVELSALSGPAEDLLAWLRQLSSEQQLAAYRYVLQFSGKAALPAVQEAAMGTTDLLLSLAATESIERWARTLPEKERKDVCDWAQKQIPKLEDRRQGALGALVIQCGEEYQKILLSYVEGLAHQKKPLFPRTVQIFKPIASAPGGVSEDYAKRLSVLLAKVAGASWVGSESRGVALRLLAMGWPEQAKPIALGLKESKQDHLRLAAHFALKQLVDKPPDL